MCHVIRRHLLPEAHGYMYHFVVQTYYCTRLGTCLNGTAEVYFFSLDPTLVSRPEPLNPSWLCLAQPAQPGGGKLFRTTSCSHTIPRFMLRCVLELHHFFKSSGRALI